MGNVPLEKGAGVRNQKYKESPSCANAKKKKLPDASEAPYIVTLHHTHTHRGVFTRKSSPQIRPESEQRVLMSVT